MRLPTVPRQYFDNHDELVLAGFTQLCNLFSVLDDKFVEVWYQDDSESTPFQNIAAIQHELNQLDFMKTKMTDVQKADVLITHQWLRLIFWQASMRQGLINSSSIDEVFFYNYPIVIAKDLCRVMRGLQYDAIQVHGLGIFEKVFEVAYTLLDALTIAKLDWSMSDELSPNSHNTYVKVLENKINLENNGAASPLSQIG
ncbi:hypothetical protein LTS08_003872 [Lithohypha guttulata]|uniref:Uncharacterized protein n=1 Tax=Lithohypha guttulata TaxID=1690604 RepID=A0AAN7SXJ1_9EURO|nr:hypothetical protein LTR51_001173 [Lithohypha guttulata]KAK5083670.1 hypothetical protein LTR05_006174 [Lithohypha guttulata]KAK5103069.1 hypothetical protein LTS08_003872 [Lithohypha guttulata]